MIPSSSSELTKGCLGFQQLFIPGNPSSLKRGNPLLYNLPISIYFNGMKSKTLKQQEGKIAPYLIAWLLGVPTSILVIIFLIRGCH